MKKFLSICLILWSASFLLPTVFVKRSEGDIPPLPVPSAEENLLAIDDTIEVSVNCSGEILKMPLSEYLEGVVAAEMPALFPEEALRAQAVAARTYTMKKMSASPAKEHGGAHLCNNPSHCKAYEPLSSFAASWEGKTDEYSKKIKRAVSDTDGEIILYNDEPISAVFHSTSSGKTENAKDVWGGDAPYLISVESKGEEASPRYVEEKSFTPDEFKEIFSKNRTAVSFDENPENWVSNISRSEAGGIKSLSVAGVSVKGSEMRSLFGLNSTNFTLTFDEGVMKFKTKGYGHGVGMSQYGARAMAEEGKTYEEILKKYYTGVTLGKISKKASS